MNISDSSHKFETIHKHAKRVASESARELVVRTIFTMAKSLAILSIQIASKIITIDSVSALFAQDQIGSFFGGL